MTIRDADGFELIEHDHYTGRTLWGYYDGEKTIYRTDYPVDNLIKTNTEQRNMAQANWAGDLHHIASVPLNIAYDSGLTEAQSQGDDKFLSKWLNNSDNRAWRTKDGKV